MHGVRHRRVFEAAGDSHHSYQYQVRELLQPVPLAPSDIDDAVAAVRAGAQLMVGVSRCHTTYFSRDGVLVAEDFDEGATNESAIGEDALRSVIASEPERAMELLRFVPRRKLRDALLAGDRDRVRACLAALLTLGEAFVDTEPVEAALAWPEEPPSVEQRAALEQRIDGLAAYHVAMAPLGYERSPAAGRAGLRIFTALVEMLGEFPRLEEYRAAFVEMIGPQA